MTINHVLGRLRQSYLCNIIFLKSLTEVLNRCWMCQLKTERCVQTSEWMTPLVLWGESYPSLNTLPSSAFVCILFIYLTLAWRDIYSCVLHLFQFETPGVSGLCASEPSALHQWKPTYVQKLCAQHHQPGRWQRGCQAEVTTFYYLALLFLFNIRSVLIIDLCFVWFNCVSLWFSFLLKEHNVGYFIL